MLYSTVFRLMYAKGNKRMKEEGLDNPELKVPVRFLIDECANVGKIPNLDKILATCRKYRISVVPIFQNYSQVVQVYGKEIANNIIFNCDTFVFLGGSDDETLNDENIKRIAIYDLNTSKRMVQAIVSNHFHFNFSIRKNTYRTQFCHADLPHAFRRTI